MPCGKRLTGCHRNCLHRQFVEDYRSAREAQQERVEEVAVGYETETAEYYRNVEPRLTFKEWLTQ